MAASKRTGCTCVSGTTAGANHERVTDCAAAEADHAANANATTACANPQCFSTPLLEPECFAVNRRCVRIAGSMSSPAHRDKKNGQHQNFRPATCGIVSSESQSGS